MPDRTASPIRAMSPGRQVTVRTRLGRWRRKRTNTTSDSVSIANWVNARSGAPWTRNRAATLYPTPPRQRAAAKRRSERAAAKAKITAVIAKTNCKMFSAQTVSGNSVSPDPNAMAETPTTVAMITVKYAGSEPDWTVAATWGAKRRSPRTDAWYTLSVSSSGVESRRWNVATLCLVKNTKIPAARVNNDKISAVVTPCHRARCTPWASESSALTAEPIRLSNAAGTTPNTTVRIANIEGGATSHALGVPCAEACGPSSSAGVLVPNAPHNKRAEYAKVKIEPATMVTKTAPPQPNGALTNASYADSFAMKPNISGTPAIDEAAMAVASATEGRSLASPER